MKNTLAVIHALRKGPKSITQLQSELMLGHMQVYMVWTNSSRSGVDITKENDVLEIKGWDSNQFVRNGRIISNDNNTMRIDTTGCMPLEVFLSGWFNKLLWRILN